MTQEIIDAEHRPIAIREEPAPLAQAQPHSLAMLDATTPEEYMDRISRVCKILVDVVEKQNLAKKLGRGDKKHVELEAWQFLASMPWIRCSAVIEWTREVGDGLGWEARALVYRDGQIVGSGEGMCLRSESSWKAPKDYFALRSMSQSRAMSRALQGPLRFIFVLAGYAGAGQEEMPADAVDEAQKPAKPAPAKRDDDTPASRESGRKAVMALARDKGISDDARHLIALHLCGKESTTAMTTPQLRALYAELTEFLRAKVSEDELETWCAYRADLRGAAS